MGDSDIIAILTADFNEAAAKPVLDRHGAALEKIRGTDGQYWINGVTDNKAPAFLKEFKKLKGVVNAYDLLDY